VAVAALPLYWVAVNVPPLVPPIVKVCELGLYTKEASYTGFPGIVVVLFYAAENQIGRPILVLLVFVLWIPL